MLFRKKSLTNILMVSLIVIVVGLLFFFFEKINEKKYQTLDAIPESSTLFIELSSLDKFYHNLDKNNIWSNLLTIRGFKGYKDQALLFDSILHLKKGDDKVFEEQKAIVSVHANHENSELLMVIKLNGNLKKKFFRTVFNQIYHETFTTLKSSASGAFVNKLVFNQYEKSFSYAIHGGLFIGSLSHELVLESLKQLKLKSNISQNQSFIEVANTAGKKVDANIFINYQQLPLFVNQLRAEQKTDSLNIFAGIADWSGLDLMIKQDELLLSGFTSSNDTTNKHVSLFKNQAPQAFEMAKIIPDNATLIHHLGIENFCRYFTSYQNYVAGNHSSVSLVQKIENLQKVLKSDAEKLFIPHIGTELALVSLATNASSYEDHSFAIVKIKNLVEVKAYLSQKAKDNAGSGLLKNYHEFSLNRINIKGFVPLIFGNTFQAIQNFNYTFINDYLIIANSGSALENFLNRYKNRLTLNLDPDYILFSDNMAERANLYFYFNIKNGLNLLEHFTNQKTYDFLIKNASAIKKNQAFGLQYLQQQNGLFTNLAINFKAQSEIKNDWIWQANTDDPISGKVHLVKNHKNPLLYTLVTDVQDWVYLFDHEGNRLWKEELDGPILSQVYEVDYFKNGKIQYLFNTSNSIYLFDVLGRAVGDFPLKLKTTATNGVSLFDYSNDQDYRIVYAGNDRKIYNFDIEGKEVTGWIKSQTANPVESQIQHLVGNNRDYILLSDNTGITRILSRRGTDRILLKTQFIKAEHSKFYVNSTNTKGLFIATNNTGKLTYIKSNGNLEYSDFGNYSADHYFFYHDFDNDKHNDFIYLDGKTLKVFNRFRQELLHFEFPAEIITAPIIFKAKDGTFTIAINDGEQRIHLFDVKGHIEHLQNETGSLEFLLADLLQDGSLNLVIGSGKSVQNYLVK